MIRRIILGSVGIVAALVFAMNVNAQQVVSSTECNSGNCSGHSHGGHGLHGHGLHGHGLHGHGLGLGAAAAGAGNGAGFGNNAGWAWHGSWGDYWARNQASQRPWHGGYYWMRTGQPTALIVPPTVTMQSNYSWGVSQNTMTPVYHQFSGNAPNGAGGGMFRATPYWPTHTDQFGVYPVRGPW